MTSQLRTQTYRSFDLADNSPSEHDAEEEAYVRIRRFGKTLAAALLKRCARMLPADWRILLWSKETDEAIIASYGSVQIRHVPGGCVVQTCVKGDMNLARGTALLRLVKYVSGDNQRAARLDAERPLLQQRKAPGLWQVAVRLYRGGRCAGGAGAPRKKDKDRRPSADHMGRHHAARAPDRTGDRARGNCDHGHTRAQPMVRYRPGDATHSCSHFSAAVRRQFRSRGACLLPHPGRVDRGRLPIPWCRVCPHQPSGQSAKPTGSLIGRGPGTNDGYKDSEPACVARWWSKSALQPLLNGGQTLLQPRSLGLAQPLAAPIHNPTCTLQKFGAGIILLQRAGDIADRP